MFYTTKPDLLTVHQPRGWLYTSSYRGVIGTHIIYHHGYTQGGNWSRLNHKLNLGCPIRGWASVFVVKTRLRLVSTLETPGCSAFSLLNQGRTLSSQRWRVAIRISRYRGSVRRCERVQPRARTSTLNKVPLSLCSPSARSNRERHFVKLIAQE